ncbi:MAG: YraN family protein [Chloroflexi bacterium]|nr:YraN family protein [Chloroflexota bacterium]
MNHNQLIGKWGEQAAVEYLKQKGYTILETNTRTPYGEIDIIASLQGVFFFVEVKSRTSRTFGLPEEALTPRKLAHMRACAEYYAAKNELETWQCDAIAVEGNPGKTPQIEHFENVTC